MGPGFEPGSSLMCLVLASAHFSITWDPGGRLWFGRGEVNRAFSRHRLGPELLLPLSISFSYYLHVCVP